MFLLAMATFANQAMIELGVLRAQALQVDETYFAACAARGTAIGEYPPAGCHDNKAPLIFLAHQAVQWLATPYDIAAIKQAAFALVLSVAGLAAWLAWRLSPPKTAVFAALSAAALVVQALLGVDVSLMALKTEMIGIAFVLMSLLVCLPRAGLVSAGRWALAGVFAGLAVMSKQTFALSAFALVGWGAFTALQAPSQQRKAAMTKCVCLVVGLCTPLIVLLTWFALDGRVDEFLASIFLYPSVYGSPPTTDSAIKRAIWRFAHILHTLSLSPLVLACFCIGSVAVFARVGESVDGESRAHTAPGLIGIVIPTTFAMLSVTLIAPIFFDFHLVPSLVL
ncbi:MAG: hypothetical protein H7Z15_03950, partial [Rhizobacter sp.]|nr:hypothetical protein [Rhizobacter sp.]